MKRIAQLLLALLVTACGADASTAPATPNRTPGTLALRLVNAQPLPYALTTVPNAGPWYVRGALELKAGGQYTQTLTDSGTGRAAASSVESGSWSVIGSDSLRLVPASGGSDYAIASTTQVTRTEFGRVYVFAR